MANKNLFIKRTIKNGKIQYNHRIWTTKGDVSHLEEMRLVFGTYTGMDNLLSLWGTIKLFESTSEKENHAAWEEWCKLAGVEETPEKEGGGQFLMLKSGDDFTSFRSRNITWWRPMDKEK